MYNPKESHKISEANVGVLIFFTKAVSESLFYGAELVGTIALVLEEHLKFQRSLRQHGKVLRIEDLIDRLRTMDLELARHVENCEILKFDLGRLWIKQDQSCLSGTHLWLMREKIVEALEECYKCKFRVRFVKQDRVPETE